MVCLCVVVICVFSISLTSSSLTSHTHIPPHPTQPFLPQVLTHIREKLRFVENENATQHVELSALEERIVGFRGDITVSKKDRETVRLDNKDLKRQQGFASSSLLLVDFEKRKGQLENLRAQIQEIQERASLLETQIANDKSKVKFQQDLLAVSRK